MLVLVYGEDDVSTPIASRVLDFHSLVPRQYGGAQELKVWPAIEEFVYGETEIVVAVIYDGWRYTPQNMEVVGKAHVAPSIEQELVYSILQYLKEHPEEVIKVAKIVIGAPV